jgi:hypothetical protein
MPFLLVLLMGYLHGWFVKYKCKGKLGVTTMEYGITIGTAALLAALIFAQASTGIKSLWTRAADVTSQSPAGQASPGPKFVECMAKAHGDSKFCSNAGF